MHASRECATSLPLVCELCVTVPWHVREVQCLSGRMMATLFWVVRKAMHTRACEGGLA